MTLVFLAIVGATEAVVYQGRYRATHGSAWAVGLWTFAVCVLRVAFMALGVSAALGEAGIVLAMLCYAIPAAITTAIVRGLEKGRAKAASPA